MPKKLPKPLVKALEKSYPKGVVLSAKTVKPASKPTAKKGK